MGRIVVMLVLVRLTGRRAFFGFSADPVVALTEGLWVMRYQATAMVAVAASNEETVVACGG